MKLKNKKYLIAAITGSLLVGSLATAVAVSCSKEDKNKVEFASNIKLTKDQEGYYYATFKTKSKKEDVLNASFSVSQNENQVVISKPKNLREQDKMVYFELKLPKLDSKNDVKLILSSNNQKFEKINFNLTKEQLSVGSSTETTSQKEEPKNNENSQSSSNNEKDSNKESSTPATNEKETSDQSAGDQSQGGSQQPNTQPETQPSNNQNVDSTPPTTGSESNDANKPNPQPTESQPTVYQYPTTSSNGAKNNVQLRNVNFTQSISNNPLIQFDFSTDVQIDYGVLSTFKIILEDNTLVETSMEQNHGSNQYSGTAMMPETNSQVKIKGIKFTRNNVENTYLFSESEAKTFTVKK